MKHTWVPYAAIAAGTLLLLKAVLIISTQDEVPGAPVAAMYLGGLLIALAAAIGAGLSAPRLRPLAALGLALLLVAWVIGLGDVTGPVFEAVLGEHEYVNDEGPVGLLGAILLALGARAHVGSRELVPA